MSKSPDSNHWLLTSWENEKTAAYATGEVRDSAGATAAAPTLNRRNGVNTTVSTVSISTSSEKVNNKNSVKDSEGKMLTEQQSEYFKNSKVRDADGKLLVVYHGTDDIPSIYVETIIEKQSKDDFLADLNKVRKEHAQSVNQNYSVTDRILPSSEKVNNKIPSLIPKARKKSNGNGLSVILTAQNGNIIETGKSQDKKSERATMSTDFGRKQFRNYLAKEAAKGNLVRIKNRNIITGEHPAPIAVRYGNDVSTKNLTTFNAESQEKNSERATMSTERVIKRHPDSALITNLL